jgi:hypothetical protein
MLPTGVEGDGDVDADGGKHVWRELELHATRQIKQKCRVAEASADLRPRHAQAADGPGYRPVVKTEPRTFRNSVTIRYPDPLTSANSPPS